MSEELVVRHCSPTLAGVKTGSIFSCCYESRDELKEYIRGLNGALVKKGLRVLPLRAADGKALIYIYRPCRLANDLKQNTAAQLLSRHDYDSCSPERCIIKLMARLKKSEEFPHEIGLFLGYPAEDVQGFIDNKAACCKCVGAWKVYGDEKAAQKTFAKYRKCTEIYCKKYADGATIERLAVKVR